MTELPRIRPRGANVALVFEWGDIQFPAVATNDDVRSVVLGEDDEDVIAAVHTLADELDRLGLVVADVAYSRPNQRLLERVRWRRSREVTGR